MLAESQAELPGEERPEAASVEAALHAERAAELLGDEARLGAAVAELAAELDWVELAGLAAELTGGVELLGDEAAA